MAASITLTNLKVNQTATATVAGASNNTAYTVNVTHSAGHTQVLSLTTDGGGGGSVKFVPQGAGSYTVTLNSTAAQVATTTLQSSQQ